VKLIRGRRELKESNSKAQIARKWRLQIKESDIVERKISHKNDEEERDSTRELRNRAIKKRGKTGPPGERVLRGLPGAEYSSRANSSGSYPIHIETDSSQANPLLSPFKGRVSGAKGNPLLLQKERNRQWDEQSALSRKK